MQAPEDRSLSLEGPAFGPLVRVLASLLVAAILAKSVQLIGNSAWNTVPWTVMLFGAAALAVIAGGYWSIMTGRTSIDATHIRQTGLWTREVEIARISQLKLIHWRRIAWLITPRLIVRAGGFGAQTFYCADPRVLRAFDVLAHGIRDDAG